MPYKDRKRWRAVVTIGKRRVAQKLLPTKREAQEWERAERKAFLSQIRTGSFSNAATKYLDFCKVRFSRATYGDKRKALRDLASITGDAPLGAIKPDIILQLLLAKEKKSKNLYNRNRKELHAFFNWCITFQGLHENPVARIDKLPVEREPQPVPTEEEVVRLLIACDRFDRALIIAFCTTGGRRSELFRWTWHEDVNFEKREVRLGTRKTRSGEMRYRWVRMNDMLFKALQDLWKVKLPESDYVFQNRGRYHGRYGDRFTYRRKLMGSICRRAGLSNMYGFHALRRFFASLLADKYKESIPVIKRLLGHASISTTDRYISNISRDAQRAIDQIEFEIKLPQKDTPPKQIP